MLYNTLFTGTHTTQLLPHAIHTDVSLYT